MARKFDWSTVWEIGTGVVIGTQASMAISKVTSTVVSKLQGSKKYKKKADGSLELDAAGNPIPE